MKLRVILLKSWTNEFGRTYPVGTIIQGTTALLMNLIGEQIGELYAGEYPPKEKRKINLKQLK